MRRRYSAARDFPSGFFQHYLPSRDVSNTLPLCEVSMRPQVLQPNRYQHRGGYTVDAGVGVACDIFRVVEFPARGFPMSCLLIGSPSS